MSSKVSRATKIQVWELHIDKKSVLDSFISEIEKDGTSVKDLFGAIKNLELAADLKRLPKTKFREIVNKKLDVKLYEAKKGAVRIYHYHEEHTGRIIILGGYKTEQNNDIKQAIKRIKDYQNEHEKRF